MSKKLPSPTTTPADLDLTDAGVLVVVGDGPGASEALASIKGSFDIMAINKALEWIPQRVKYWASWHDLDKMAIQAALHNRTARGGNIPERCFSMFASRMAERVDVPTYGGGSAALGVSIGLNILGYGKIIVVGAILDGEYETFREGWDAAVEAFGNRVRAIGGYTSTLLGEPTQEWVQTK